MEKSKIDLYLTTNAKYFEPTVIPILRQKLEQSSDDVFLTLQATELTDPVVLLIISLLLGSLGIDRFMIGDIGMGVLKLLTGGLCGILTVIDWFTIMKKAKVKNFATISTIL